MVQPPLDLGDADLVNPLPCSEKGDRTIQVELASRKPARIVLAGLRLLDEMIPNVLLQRDAPLVGPLKRDAPLSGVQFLNPISCQLLGNVWSLDRWLTSPDDMLDFLTELIRDRAIWSD